METVVLPGSFQPDMRIPAFLESGKAMRSLVSDWTKAKMQHRECLIRAALLRFLTPFEIDLTATTKSKALLDYHGLVLEHVLPPSNTRFGMDFTIPETFRIHKDGKLALSVNLEMNQGSLQ